MSQKPFFVTHIIISNDEPRELTDKSNTRCHSADTYAILSMIDVLVDGEFIKEQMKNLNIQAFGCGWKPFSFLP